MTVFNFGPQHAGNINNVGGDQHINGGQYGAVVPPAVHRAVVDLRAGLAAAPLAPRHAAQAAGHLDEVDRQLRRPEPDRDAVARSLGRLTDLLHRTGALVTAGAGVLGPLRDLAGWLGALGAPLLAALTGR